MSLRNIENMQENQKRKQQKNFLECEKKWNGDTNKPVKVMNYSMKLEWYGCNQKWYRALNGACSLFLYEMMRWPRTLLYVLFELEAMAMYLNYLFFHAFLLPQRVEGKKKLEKVLQKSLCWNWLPLFGCDFGDADTVVFVVVDFGGE